MAPPHDPLPESSDGKTETWQRLPDAASAGEATFCAGDESMLVTRDDLLRSGPQEGQSLLPLLLFANIRVCYACDQVVTKWQDGEAPITLEKRTHHCRNQQ